MSTLYIRLHSRTSLQPDQNKALDGCGFALVNDAGMIEREGVLDTSGLTGVLQKAGQVIVLLEACDVSLLLIPVPPMSASKLQNAIPNLVEEHLIGDPAECVFAAEEIKQGSYMIAATQRDWLAAIVSKLVASGAKQVAALPSQMCLPETKGTMIAAITVHGKGVDITLRQSTHEGLGLTIGSKQSESTEEVLRTLSTLVSGKALRLLVPGEHIKAYKDAAGVMKLEHIQIAEDEWQLWIDGAQSKFARSLDLSEDLHLQSSKDEDWRFWRWTAGVALAIIAANIFGLNVSWWKLKREAQSLQASMIHIFKSTFPNETVIVDPVAQTRRKIADARVYSGQYAADDFLALTAGFSDAWHSIGQGGADMPGIAGLEYRDRTLTVRLNVAGTDAKNIIDVMRPVLMARKLSLEQTEDNHWKIRSEE